jgi:hypothetical protein
MKKQRAENLQSAFEAAGFNGQPTLKAMSEYLDVDPKTVKNHIREHGGFVITNQGEVMRKPEKVE